MKKIFLYTVTIFIVFNCFTNFSWATTPKVAAGYVHNMALKADGSVWVWGANDQWQLGNHSNDASSTPISVAGMTGVKQIAAGMFYSLALKEDGTLWVWGSNSTYRLGNGSDDYSYDSPHEITGISNVTDISAGSYHMLALKADGTVWAWGYNYFGQLGDSTTSDRYVPVQVSGLSEVIAVAAGFTHSIALKSDGTVWAWGNNSDGQLGDGTEIDQSVPVMVSNLSGIISISTTEDESLALREDSSVWSWGNYSSKYMNKPFMVSDLLDVEAIGTGDDFSLALKNDGTLMSWGDNDRCQLGDGTTEERDLPVQVTGIGPVMTSAGGEWHSIAVTVDGSVWVWGDNSLEQLCDGTTTNRSTPIQVPDFNLFSVGSGTDSDNDGVIDSNDNCALVANSDQRDANNNSIGDACDIDSDTDSDGLFDSQEYYYKTDPDDPDSDNDGLTDFQEYESGTHPCQSDSDGDFILDGADIAPLTPAVLPDVSGYEDGHILFLKADGTVWAMGDNDHGQLGDGSTEERDEPVQVPGLENVKNVYASGYRSYAMKLDGSVWRWGRFPVSVLAGTYADYSSPVNLSSLSNVNKISIGGLYNSTQAIGVDGTLWAWDGYVPDGAGSIEIVDSMPVNLFDLEDIVDIAYGLTQTLAVKSNGTVLTWGVNPVQVSGLNNIAHADAGMSHFLALTSGGTVWAWGSNENGQLGTGTTGGYYDTPIQVPGLDNIFHITANTLYSIAFKTDGTIWVWGDMLLSSIPSPSQILELPDMMKVTENGYLILRNAGTVWILGADYSGFYKERIENIYLYNRIPVQMRSTANDDTDLDGFSDSIDNCPNIYNPDQADANGDGIGDVCDPSLDTDGDGISDITENANCTDPSDSDTDDDGIPDGVEDENQNGSVDAGETNPCDADTDNDGIQDGTEIGLTLIDIGSDTDSTVFIPDSDPTSLTDPLDTDSDNDGINDGDEDLNYNGMVDSGETDPAVSNKPKGMPWLNLLLSE